MGTVEYAFRMRFRAKFGIDAWTQVGLAILMAFPLVFGRNSGFGKTEAFLAVLISLPAVFMFLSRYFIYWELAPTCIREREFWNEKEVTWNKVTHVDKYLPGLTTDHALAVWYVNPASRSGRSYIVANPEDRKDFIAALRRFAPLAIFDV
jgi:hypothetical protein